MNEQCPSSSFNTLSSHLARMWFCWRAEQWISEPGIGYHGTWSCFCSLACLPFSSKVLFWFCCLQHLLKAWRNNPVHNCNLTLTNIINNIDNHNFSFLTLVGPKRWKSWRFDPKREPIHRKWLQNGASGSPFGGCTWVCFSCCFRGTQVYPSGLPIGELFGAQMTPKWSFCVAVGSLYGSLWPACGSF